MMREILFRGRTTKDKEWVYGDLLHDGYDYDVAIWEKETKRVTEVSSETVGQFTGLTTHGKKIFEGDIIRSDNGRISAVSVVKYGNFRPKMIYYMFRKCIGYSPKQDLHGVYCESSKEQMMLFDSPTYNKVIGNIHDNPELLEVE